MYKTEPCTCSGPFPLTTLERKKMMLLGAEHVDAITPEGRWHAVKVGPATHLIQLVTPSIERVAEDEIRALELRRKEEAKWQREQTRLSALSKLKALGLTDEEIESLGISR